ncbi:glycosyl transferase, family 2 [Chitinispirillum alkaliphilum]|nr:glycosyl transferase, family 2 [Chitinispirillum alkaliphilum]
MLKSETDNKVKICVIDDGSGEAERNLNKNICAELGVSYVRCSKNRGMAVARNIGIRHSNGNWVLFLDDDVEVKKGWYKVLKKHLKSAPDDVIGFEGKVTGTGQGLWDREVENLCGGQFLTCHIAYRKDMLMKIGCFDETFEYLGPFCEDHEIAVRALREGNIIFLPDLKADHMARNVVLIRMLMNSRKRMRGIVRAEKYFFSKHPGEYKNFRNAVNFKGTYISFLVRHTLNCMRRRRFSDFLRKPGQTIMLLFISVFEQICAWTLLPEVLLNKSVQDVPQKGKPDWSK